MSSLHLGFVETKSDLPKFKFQKIKFQICFDFRLRYRYLEGRAKSKIIDWLIGYRLFLHALLLAS